MLPFERKASPSCMACATVANGRISCLCVAHRRNSTTASARQSALRFKPALIPGLKLVGPCREGDATGRGQPIKPPFDPLEPTIDIAPKILESADAKRERGASPPNEGEIKDLISLVNINYLNDLVVAGGVSLCLVGFLSPSGSSDLSVHP
jgi:hypothetical protein